MTGFVQVFGVILLLITVADIFLAVLYPRSGKGWLSVPLGRVTWKLFRFAAKISVWRQRRDRTRILSFCGPVLLIEVVTMWVILLLLGFALIFWPAFGTEIVATQGSTPTDFVTAVYYSGYSLTTLGFGDLSPKNDTYRLLTILEAAIGFSIFTLTITYLVAVYGALTQRNVFALSLHHSAAKVGNAAELLARMGADGNFNSSRQDIAQMSLNALILLESHHAYPVLHYFRFKETYYALARIALLTMDTATLIQTALHEDHYRSLKHSTAVAQLSDGGQHLLIELANSFLPGQHPKRQGQSEAVLRAWYFQAIERLKQEGIKTVSNPEAGADLYILMRRNWEPYVMSIAHYMGYEWREIAPAECLPLLREIEFSQRH